MRELPPTISLLRVLVLLLTGITHFQWRFTPLLIRRTAARTKASRLRHEMLRLMMAYFSADADFSWFVTLVSHRYRLLSCHTSIIIDAMLNIYFIDI